MKEKRIVLLENEDHAKEYLKNKEKFMGFTPISFTFEVERLLNKKGIPFKTEEDYEKDLIYSGIHLKSMRDAKKICDALKIRFRGIDLVPLFYFEIYLILASSRKYLKLLEEIIKKEKPMEIIVFKTNLPKFLEKEFCSRIVNNIFGGEVHFKLCPYMNKKDQRQNIFFRIFGLLQKRFSEILINRTKELNNNIFLSGGNLYFKSIANLLSLNKRNRLFTFDYQLRKSFFTNKKYIPFYEFSGKKSLKQETLKKDLLNLKQKVTKLNFSREFGIEVKIEEILKEKLISLIETKFLSVSRQIEEVYSLMEKNKIDLILLASDTAPFDIAIAKVAKIFKIPSIVVQHAINCTEIAYPMNSEYIFVYGEETKKWLIKINSNKNNLKKDNIFVIGCPRYDEFIPEEKGEREEKIILYLVEATSSYSFFPERSLTKKRQKEIFGRIFDVLKEFPEYKLIIKTRQNWDMSSLPDMIAKQKNFKNFEIIEKTDNVKLLNRADIVLINHTTMGIESLLLGKPTISISYKDLDDGNPFKKISAVKVTYTKKQLEDEIRNNLIQTEKDILDREESLKGSLLTDRKATFRAVKLIDQLLKK